MHYLESFWAFFQHPISHDNKQLIDHLHHHSLNQALAIYPLTEREIEIISIVTTGKSNKIIATQLFIEESTVKHHLKNIYRKLTVKSRSELIIKCMQV